MNGDKLRLLISKKLTPFGYKARGSIWTIESTELEKKINLQKSGFGNQYYLNYYFIIKKAPLDKLRGHYYERFGVESSLDNQRLTLLLDLDFEVSDEVRERDLGVFLDQLLYRVEKVNCEADLLNLLKNHKYLQAAVPIVTRQYFGLE